MVGGWGEQNKTEEKILSQVIGSPHSWFSFIAGMYVHTCEDPQRPKEDVGLLICCFPPHPVGTRSLAEPGTLSLAGLGWPLQPCPCLHPNTGVTGTHTY